MSQQALDYFAAKLPGFNDLSVLPGSVRAFVAQIGTFRLRVDVMDQDRSGIDSL